VTPKKLTVVFTCSHSGEARAVVDAIKSVSDTITSMLYEGDCLWPDSFDTEGNKTDWRYDPELELLHSPSTDDFMYRVGDNPPVDQQKRWMDRHRDAILVRRQNF